MEPCNDEQWLQPLRLSTAMLAPDERAALWREELGRIFLRLDFDPIGAPLSTNFERHCCGTLDLCFVETTAVSVSRTRELVRDGNDDYVVLLRADGARATFISGEFAEEAQSDDAALLFNGATRTLRYPSDCRLTLLRITHKALAVAVPDLDERPIRRIPPASRPLLRLLAAYTEAVRGAGSLSHPLAAHRIAHHLIDLVALALAPDPQTRNAPVPQACARCDWQASAPTCLPICHSCSSPQRRWPAGMG